MKPRIETLSHSLVARKIVSNAFDWRVVKTRVIIDGLRADVERKRRRK